MTRIDLNAFALLVLLWLSVGTLAALALVWAYKATHERPNAPVYPLDMWRQRRDVTVLGPRPYDWNSEGGDAA